MQFNGGRVQPMLARSNECCRHFLSEDWHVCGHAVRRARLPKETYNTPVPVPDRQEMGSSNRHKGTCSLTEAAYSPCSRDQMNAAVTFYRKIGTYVVTQCDAPVFRKRHTIPRCRCLTAKKWAPVIVIRGHAV